MNNPIIWLIGGVLLLIFIYLVARLISAAWHRSRIEADAELAAFRAEIEEPTKEQDHG